MNSISVIAPAKINLLLDIEGARYDGYHTMKMIMQSIDLADTITITQSEENDGITIRSNCDGIPLDDSNIVYKAAKAFFLHTLIDEIDLEIFIDKKIPFKAGLGGGSSDAAGVIVGLNEMFKTGLKQNELMKIGATIGADVPFCLVGGSALVSGIGEIVTSIKPFPECTIVVAKPAVDVDTKDAFAQYDNANGIVHKGAQDMLVAFTTDNLKSVANELFNVFEQVIKIQDVSTLKSVMLENGALGASMSGSGSAVFGLFEWHEDASACVRAICDMGIECHLCSPVNHGAKVIQ